MPVRLTCIFSKEEHSLQDTQTHEVSSKTMRTAQLVTLLSHVPRASLPPALQFQAGRKKVGWIQPLSGLRSQMSGSLHLGGWVTPNAAGLDLAANVAFLGWWEKRRPLGVDDTGCPTSWAQQRHKTGSHPSATHRQAPITISII